MFPFELKTTLLCLFHQLQNLFSKGGWLLKTVLAGWLLIAGIHTYIYTVVIFAAVDIITGIWASIKRGEHFKSALLKRGIFGKAIMYIVLLVLVFALDKLLQSVLLHSTFYLAFIVTLLISVYELTSIIENMVSINPELSFLNRFKVMLNKVVDKEMEKVENKLASIDPETPSEPKEAATPEQPVEPEA